MAGRVRWVAGGSVVAWGLVLASSALAAESGAGEASTGGELSLTGGSAEATGPGDSGAAEDSGGAEREWIGIDVGLRVGFAVPFGDLASLRTPAFATPGGDVLGGSSGDHALRDTFDGHVPIQLDLGYRITDSLVVGAYGLWGPGVLAGKSPFSCDDRPRSELLGEPDPADEEMMDTAGEPAEVPELGCSASLLRVGLQVRYHFEPHAEVDPWVGLGTGFEIASIDSDEVNNPVSFSGFEFVNVNAGLDIQLLDSFRVGPYGQFAMGQYGSVPESSDVYAPVRYKCPGGACTLDEDAVDSAGLHFWATGGVRTSYVF